jgi:putative hydroxymethylpyrimidine transporter CytX
MDLRPTRAEERTLTQTDFFFLWAGAAISVMEIFSGALLAPLGLAMGVVVIVIGHLIGNTPLALSGLHGQRLGMTSMLSTRFSFGVRGSYLFTVLNVVQLVGWMAVMQIVAADAMDAITRSMFSLSSRELWIVIIGVVTTLWAMGGQRAWKILNTVSIVLLMALTGVMTYRIFTSFPPAAAPAGSLPLGVALDLVIAMPISWLPLASDYSRFARRGSMLGTWTGYFVFSSWMYFMGLISALGTGETFPTNAMLTLGLGLPAMLVIVLSTVTSDYMDVYSAAASWLNLRERANSRRVMAAAGAAGIMVSLVFPMDQYQNFLLFIGSLFCPLFAIVITDYFMNGESYDVEGAIGGKRYWYVRGFNPRAVLAWAAGVVTFWTAGARIGGSLPSMCVSAIVYYLSTLPVSRNHR